MSWTEDRVALLKQLWGDGHTAAEIAQKLGGVTRNAVIGKAHRLKLSNRVSPIQQNKKPANKNVSRTKVVERASHQTPVVNKSAVVEKSKPVVSGDLYSLMDLQPRMCRWPSGDPKEEGFGFCGAKSVSGIPYCEEHAKTAYQTSSRSRAMNVDKAVAEGRGKVDDEVAVAG